MSPKEKSKELFFVYSQEVRGIFFRKSRIKRCALIVVDELIWLSSLYNESGYWQEVKQELNNL